MIFWSPVLYSSSMILFSSVLIVLFTCFDISFHLFWYFFRRFWYLFAPALICWIFRGPGWLTKAIACKATILHLISIWPFLSCFSCLSYKKLFFWIIYVYFYGFMHHNSILVEMCIFGVIYSSNWSPLPLFLCSWIFHLITDTLLIQDGQHCWPIINGCTKSKYELPWQKDKER